MAGVCEAKNRAKSWAKSSSHDSGHDSLDDELIARVLIAAGNAARLAATFPRRVVLSAARFWMRF